MILMSMKHYYLEKGIMNILSDITLQLKINNFSFGELYFNNYTADVIIESNDN